MENIRNTIVDILKTYFEIDYSDNEKEDTMNFFSLNVRMDIKSMVYLVTILERKYCIEFTEKDYENPDMYNLNGLCGIINRYLEKSDKLV